jgi:hypothetical protein
MSDAGQCHSMQHDPEGIGAPHRCILWDGHDGLHDCTPDRLLATIDALTAERDEAQAIDPDNPTWGTKNRTKTQLCVVIRKQHRTAKRNHEAVVHLASTVDALTSHRDDLIEANEWWEEKCQRVKAERDTWRQRAEEAEEVVGANELTVDELAWLDTLRDRHLAAMAALAEPEDEHHLAEGLRDVAAGRVVRHGPGHFATLAEPEDK